MPNQPNISQQVTHAMEASEKKKSDLAEILDVSIRQIDKLLLSGRWNAEQLKKLSDALDWQFVIDPYGSTKPTANVLNEPGVEYNARPLTFNITLDRNTAKKVPGLVEELEELIKRRMEE